MLTLGVDLASDPKKTGVCLLDWRSGRPVIRKTGGRGDDDELRGLIRRADKVGIDVPLGWPADFVKAVSAWSEGKKWPDAAKVSLRYRGTDCGPGRPPLSVSSDRLAVPAFRAAALLSSLDLHAQRDGRGKIVEVYPVASLRAWLKAEPPSEYKRPDAAGRRARRSLLTRLLRGLGQEPGRFAEFRESCLEVHDIFDAFVAALTARAAALGLTVPPTPGQQDKARIEGWIHRPAEGSAVSELCERRLLVSRTPLARNASGRA